MKLHHTHCSKMSVNYTFTIVSAPWVAFLTVALIIYYNYSRYVCHLIFLREKSLLLVDIVLKLRFLKFFFNVYGAGRSYMAWRMVTEAESADEKNTQRRYEQNKTLLNPNPLHFYCDKRFVQSYKKSISKLVWLLRRTNKSKITHKSKINTTCEFR